MITFRGSKAKVEFGIGIEVAEFDKVKVVIFFVEVAVVCLHTCPASCSSSGHSSPLAQNS